MIVTGLVVNLCVVSGWGVVNQATPAREVYLLPIVEVKSAKPAGDWVEDFRRVAEDDQGSLERAIRQRFVKDLQAVRGLGVSVSEEGDAAFLKWAKERGTSFPVEETKPLLMATWVSFSKSRNESNVEGVVADLRVLIVDPEKGQRKELAYTGRFKEARRGAGSREPGEQAHVEATSNALAGFAQRVRRSIQHPTFSFFSL